MSINSLEENVEKVIYHLEDDQPKSYELVVKDGVRILTYSNFRHAFANILAILYAERDAYGKLDGEVVLRMHKLFKDILQREKKKEFVIDKKLYSTIKNLYDNVRDVSSLGELEEEWPKIDDLGRHIQKYDEIFTE